MNPCKPCMRFMRDYIMDNMAANSYSVFDYNFLHMKQRMILMVSRHMFSGSMNPLKPFIPVVVLVIKL